MKASKLIYACTLCLSVMILSATVTPARAQDNFSGVFIFGDSLSDAGNIYALTGETSKAPYAVIPSRPYAIGGHHFSNGKTWAERFAQDLQMNSSGKASLANPGKNGNYAFGGARARLVSGSSAPYSGIQVGMFHGEHPMAPSDALYVVQFGGNDIRDAMEAVAMLGIPNPTLPEIAAAAFPILDAAVEATLATIETLSGYGADTFLVANAPNLAHAPAVKMLGASLLAEVLTGYYNAVLDGALYPFDVDPDITIYRLNMAEFIDNVVTSPGDFGMTNVTSPCLIFYTESGAKCQNVSEYLFWDGIHPTAAGHNALADAAMAAISGN